MLDFLDMRLFITLLACFAGIAIMHWLARKTTRPKSRDERILELLKQLEEEIKDW